MKLPGYENERRPSRDESSEKVKLIKYEYNVDGQEELVKYVVRSSIDNKLAYAVDNTGSIIGQFDVSCPNFCFGYDEKKKVGIIYFTEDATDEQKDYVWNQMAKNAYEGLPQPKECGDKEEMVIVEEEV